MLLNAFVFLKRNAIELSFLIIILLNWNHIKLTKHHLLTPKMEVKGLCEGPFIESVKILSNAT